MTRPSRNKSNEPAQEVSKDLLCSADRNAQYITRNLSVKRIDRHLKGFSKAVCDIGS